MSTAIDVIRDEHRSMGHGAVADFTCRWIMKDPARGDRSRPPTSSVRVLRWVKKQ